MTKRKMITYGMKKYQIFFSFFLLQAAAVFCQTIVYDNFEGNKVLYYGERNGVLDTLAKNPAPDSVNNSMQCALYIRNGSKKFDNIKMELVSKLSDVSPFATYLGVPPKIKMKIYTTAPVGTLVEILLGSKRGNNDYPAGTNSQYQAYTTVSNKWQELEFKFSQIPQGSETSTTQIDQVILLFNPNSSNSDKYYFDEITGPRLIVEKSEPIATPTEVTKKPGTVKKINTSKKISKK
ncbi:MAG TPA: hypothetical protein VNZ49_08980 [Bacteroidia bacterium]|nr:hypothetical protein [Bacteroidia bacterium]